MSQSTGRFRWQWSLLTLLLLTAAVAAYAAWWNVRRQTEQLLAELAQMRDLAAELLVEDPRRYAIVDVPPQWHEEDRWQVYLPPGGAYQLRLATQDIEAGALPEFAQQFALAAGRHEVALERAKEDDAWQITALVDGKEAIKRVEPGDWDPGRGGSGTGGFRHVKQESVERPLILKRWQFRPKEATQMPDGPTNGFALWIEQAPAASAADDSRDLLSTE